MSDWPYTHVEMVDSCRRLLLRRDGPWLFDGEEHFHALGDHRSRIQIGDFGELGRGLVIDGTVQLTEAVDGLYTTALVFPAALAARSRGRWLIVGGGDGATPREALRFRDTESVRLVDISRVVIEQTQALIPSFWRGCQHDSRLAIEVRDAGEVLARVAAEGPRVDVLVYDLSDPGDEACNPFGASAADHLYSEDAFQVAARCLRPGGIFVGQMAEFSLIRSEEHRRARARLRRAFRHVSSYRTPVEPFGYWESFLVASNDDGPWDPGNGRAGEEILARTYDGDWRAHWSARWHEHLFVLPPALASLI